MAEDRNSVKHNFRILLTAMAVALALVTIAGRAPVLAADHNAPPLHKATEYPCFETHDTEHVSIAVDPYDSADKGKFFRFDYLSVGFMPIRLVVQNDSDVSLDLNEARILFITVNGDRINAATVDDLTRAGGTLKMHQPGSINPLPIPFPRKPSDKNVKQITDDYNAFSYTTALVAPHTTASGFLWYDISGLEKPVLKGSQMYIRMVRKSDGKELFNFNIPFDKYLQMQ